MVQSIFAALKCSMKWVVLSVFIATLGHGYFLYKYTDGMLMKGINDGLSQMLPFKMFIYEHYKIGEFFYSDSFGLGGGFFSQLGYYYTTNIFFLIIAGLLFVIELITPLEITMDVWTLLVLPMSIVKLTCIILGAFAYFKTIRLSSLAAYVGAVAYAVSPFYFRHEMYWDFFSDALFWFVLLLIGVERVIQKQGSGLFIFAAACTLINNFYFAYINFILVGLYILARQFVRFYQDEKHWNKQLPLYAFGFLCAFGISAWAFVPAVSGYLNNFRPTYEESLALIEISDNIFFNPRVLSLPIIVFMIMLCRPLYRNKLFLFFAFVALFGTIGHLIPYVNSVFNGFSAPQNRWEAIVYLAYAAMMALAIEYYKLLKRRYFYIGGSLFFVLGFAAIFSDPSFNLGSFEDYAFILLSVTILVNFIVALHRSNAKAVLAVLTILFVLINVNIFQMNRLDRVAMDSHAPTREFMNSSLYNAPDQQALILKMKQNLLNPYQRIDWMVPLRNNTPIVQQFDGVSVYSSILNKHLLMLYQQHLEIDMGRESVSRYGTLGARSNLMSLWQVQYYMRAKENESIPYAFLNVDENDHYAVYENTQPIPTFRVVNQLISENIIYKEHVITKERAMLIGSIIEQKGYENLFVERAKKVELSSKHYVQAVENEGILEVFENNGGVTYTVKPSKEAKDLFVSFSIEGLKKKKEFVVKINEYETLRKESHSIYKTGFEKVTIRITKDSTISIQLPKGKYKIKNLTVYEEDYHILDGLTNHQEANIQWQNSTASGSVDGTNGQFLITPIPYEQGWEAMINGEQVAIHKVNYAFIGLPLQNGNNEITLSYKPPYFSEALLISLATLLLLCITFLLLRKWGKG